MRPAVLVAFVDALGPTQAEPLAARLGGLTLRGVEGILGYSSGALPTILTGRSPSEHGRMCLFTRHQGPGSSPLAPLSFLGLLPDVVRTRPRVQRAVTRIFSAATGRDGYFTPARVPPALFKALDAPEDRDLFTAPEIGGCPTFLAEAREAGLRVSVADWRTTDAARVDAIGRATDADVSMLYFSGLDGLLHKKGAVDDEARAWLASAGDAIDRARARLSHGGRRDVVTLVVGDHGMAPIVAHVDPRSAVAAIERMRGAPRVFVDATMLRVFANGADHAPIARALTALGCDVLDAEALAAQRAARDARYGDLIGLLPEGGLFVPNYFGGAIAGMHGYDRSAASARAALLTDVAGAEAATSLEDVADLVRAAAGFGAKTRKAAA